MKINTLRIIFLAVILCIISSANSLRKSDPSPDCAVFKDNMTKKQFDAIQKGKAAIAAYRAYQVKDNKEWEEELPSLKNPIKANQQNQEKIEAEAAQLNKNYQNVNLDKELAGDKTEVEKQKSNDKINKRLSEIGDLRIEYAELGNKLGKVMTDSFDKRWEARMVQYEIMKKTAFAAIDEAMESCTKGAGIKIADVAANMKNIAKKKESKPQSRRKL